MRALLARLFIAAFGVNWIWEMTQMQAYTELAAKPWHETVVPCTIASVGDGGIALGIYFVAALFSKNAFWGVKDTWKGYAVFALLGALVAIVVEWVALSQGQWSYGEKMPVLPIGVGLWPFLQLVILMPLSLWIANVWHQKAAG